MLTPSANDPKRKDELKRRESNPSEFGTKQINKLPNDWTPNKLKSDSDVESKSDDEPVKRRGRPPKSI